MKTAQVPTAAKTKPKIFIGDRRPSRCPSTNNRLHCGQHRSVSRHWVRQALQCMTRTPDLRGGETWVIQTMSCVVARVKSQACKFLSGNRWFSRRTNSEVTPHHRDLLLSDRK